MKTILVSSLKNNEKLSYDITDANGSILIKAGTIITQQHIKRLQDNGIYIIQLPDNNADMIKYKEQLKDKYMENLKYSALENIPDAFDGILNNSKENLKPLKNDIFKMVDHVIREGSITTNLFEIKSFDDYTYVHCIDTCIMSIFLGSACGLKKSEINELALAAALHDIGKIKIPNNIINKASKLNDDEFDMIKKHPYYGQILVSDIPGISLSIRNAVGQHHERYDGKGYPKGLSHNHINFFARIISVCDVFTAVSANRSYRQRFQPNDAYELILTGSGSQFDPEIVKQFKDAFSIYPIGCSLRLSNGMSGVVIKQNLGFPDRPIVKIFNKEDSDWKGSFELDLLNNIDVTVVDAS